MRAIPLLYSFRRCPYAIRARFAIFQAGLEVELREVKLADKAPEFVDLSKKATVPVMLTESGEVIEESLDIMIWALTRSDPEKWLESYDSQLVLSCENEFKPWLDRYKYADRYPQYDENFSLQQCEAFLAILNLALEENTFLSGSNFGLTDAAIFPFIRQFRGVNADWFDQSQYRALANWLQNILDTDHFKQTMLKYDFWKNGDKVEYFPKNIS